MSFSWVVLILGLDGGRPARVNNRLRVISGRLKEVCVVDFSFKGQKSLSFVSAERERIGKYEAGWEVDPSSEWDVVILSDWKKPPRPSNLKFLFEFFELFGRFVVIIEITEVIYGRRTDVPGGQANKGDVARGVCLSRLEDGQQGHHVSSMFVPWERHDKFQTLIAGCFPWLGASCTQRKVSMVLFVLPSILLLVVIVVTVVIVVVIPLVVVVAIVGVVVVVVGSSVPSINKLSFVIVGSFSCYWSSICPGVLMLMFSWEASICKTTQNNNLQVKSGGGVVDLTGDEDPTDEDGDIGVSVSLGDEIFSEEKES
ncbi:hypothetical protein Tco_1185962 [Tanacetum coccineum]